MSTLHFQKVLLGIFRKIGILPLNVLLLFSVLSSNFTGIVQAKAAAESTKPDQTAKTVPIASSTYKLPVFVHPEPRLGGGIKNQPTERLKPYTSPSNVNSTNPRINQYGSGCIQPPSGLIDWWTADGDTYDLVGGHHGTLVNGTTYASGRTGQAFSFDGVNSSVSLGNWFNYQDFTVSMWLNAGSTQTTYANIIDNNHGAGPNWVIEQNGSQVNHYTFNGVVAINLTANQWQHLAISHDSDGNYRAYLNGILLGTSHSGAINYNGNQFLRLAQWGGGGRYWHGLMDEVEIYNRALTDTEVTNLFNADSSGLCSDQSAVNLPSAPVIANNIDTATVGIVLKDSAGTVLPNHTVAINVSGTGNTVVGSSTAVTSADGSATFGFKSTHAEDKRITISDQTQGTILYNRPSVTFIPGPVDNLRSKVETNLTSLPDDGISPATVTVTALDAYDNPVAGSTVVVAATGSAIVTQPTGTTNSQGKVTATVVDAVPEIVTVSAIANGVPISSNVQIHYHCRTSGNLTVVASDSCTLNAGTYTFNNLTVQSGGTLILLGNTSTSTGVTITTNTIVVEANGTITGDGRGYTAGTGTGPGPGGFQAAGGGHGGQGGNGNGTTIAGISYGDVYNPITLGSGGGNGSNGGSGGTGAGAIRLIVSNTLNLNGAISANGSNGNTYWGAGGGGAGGSIWITADSLSGNGTIRANGGDGGNWSGVSGGGGGGRIAIDVPASSNSFNGAVTAYGGWGNQYGGPGTIYWKAADRLVINNNTHVGAAAGLKTGNYHFAHIDIKNQGVLRVLGAGSALTVDSTTLDGSDGTGRLEVEGTLTAPANYVINTTTIAILNDIQGTTDITTQPGGGLELYANSVTHPSGIYSFQNVTIKTNTILRLVSTNSGQNAYGVTLQLNNLTVEPNAAITSDGLGYGAGAGPGAGPNGSQAAGGGHGGQGGKGSGTSVGGASYGDIYSPVTLGSGGGSGGNGGSGAAGGGAIRIIVNDTLTLNGLISANGLNGNAYFGAGGGGAGGSIWITAVSLVGSGKISAIGGDGPNSYGVAGGGGGGRLAIYANTRSPNLIYTAKGGAGYEAGGNGSIFFGGIDQTQSTVQVSPPTVTADGTSTGIITVTLKNIDDYPIPNSLVEIMIASGLGLNINNQAVTPGQYITIGSTNSNGTATATLKTTQAGTRILQARSDQILIGQQGTVTFTAGPVSSRLSDLIASPLSLPADGQTPSSITVTAVDAHNNPIPGATVVLQVNGQAVVTQPSSTTDSQGKATGHIVDSVNESVTVSATVNGVMLQDQANLKFNGTDLTLSASAPATGLANGSIDYTFTLQNVSSLAAGDVILQAQLPVQVNFISQTASIQPTQNGQTLTWNFGTVLPDVKISFILTGHISASANIGDTLELQSNVVSSAPEETPSNNFATVQTSIVDGHDFVPSITPNSGTLSIGGTVVYQVNIKNIGLVGDQYDLVVSGLDSGLYTLSGTSAALLPGQSTNISLMVHTDTCRAASNIPFQVDITRAGTQQTKTVSGSVDFQSAPILTGFVPQDQNTLGSRDVTVNWQSNTPSTGILTVFPQGHPESATTFNSVSGTSHSVVVPNLVRNTSYEWYVDASSDCGTATSPHRHFTVGNGIVFVNRSQSVTIDRDYDQRVSVSVRNDDSAPHTLTASVSKQYEDILVNFVDSGSLDETITLQPGQTRQVTLALFTQDATLRNYDLTATLVADQATTPITDNMTVHVTVLSDGDFSIVEDSAAFDPVTLAKTYVITNNGKPITDLALTAVDEHGAPAKILLQPSLDHARLETGQSIRVVAYPIFTAEDVTAQINGVASSPHLASQMPDIGGSQFTLIASGAGKSVPLSGSTSCPTGKSIIAVQMNNCSMTFGASDWYCTNRPNITTPLQVPAFIKPENITSAILSLVYAPHDNVLPHNGQIDFNGKPIASYTNEIPSGQYSFNLSASDWKTGMAGSVVQSVDMHTQHSNSAHYVSVTNYQLQVSVSQATTYVCADSQGSAQQIVQKVYACQTVIGFNPLTDVYPGSTTNLGNNKSTNGANVDTDCPLSSSSKAHASCGDPIDTKTGAFSFTMSDMSIPTSAGELAFQRSYSSFANAQAGPLGYGWTDNHDAKLIFPTDPGGMEGYVLFKSVLGNQFLFQIQPDGSFTPGPGVLASLTKSGTPATYTLTTSQQSTFHFDQNGRLTLRRDSQGHVFNYEYNTQAQLVKVNADSGAHFIQISYDAQGRVDSVSDQTSREVSYGYNAAGDLVTATDVLGKTWSYVYNDNHRMTQMLDPDHKLTTKTEYDLQGRAYRQYDGANNLLAMITYNSDGSSTIYDASGHSQKHSYDSRNIANQTTDALGKPTIKTFDPNFRPTTIKDPSGATTSLAWSTDGINLTQVVDASGGKTDITYDTNNNPTSVTDARNSLTTFVYNGSLLSRTVDALDNTTQYSYTPEGWLSSVTDARGKTTLYRYNTSGQRTSMTDALGKTWTYGYDSLGRLSDTTDPLGRVTHNEYDAAGQLTIAVRNYDSNHPQNFENQYNIVTTYTYDARGNQVSVTDTFNHTTNYQYDDAGRLTATIDPEGNTTSNTYDVNGNLSATNDALGHTTTYTYDADGRLTATTDAAGHTTRTAYNPDGTVASTTDALSRVTRYQYDALKRAVAVTDAAGGVTRSEYDKAGNLTASIDALGKRTTYEYDALGRQIKQTDPLGGVTETFFDEAGNRIQTKDPRGNATTYTYDDANRLLSVTDALGNATQYEYDELGRRTVVVDAEGKRTIDTYDALDRVVAVTDPLGHVTHTNYDALGRTLSSADANGNATSFIYDALNRLTSQTDAAGGVTGFTYDPNGNRLSTTDPNQHTGTTTYDILNRAVSQTDPLGNTTSTTYDAAGQVASSTDSLGHTSAFGYDNLGRQVSVTDSLGKVTHNAYDAGGRLTDTTDANGVVSHYEYDALGRLTAVIENYHPGSQATNEINVRTEYTYDANGNRLSIQDGNGHTTSFAYDGLNHLISETDPLGHTWTYQYDALGNRVSMTDANGVTTAYNYNDGSQLTGIDYPGTSADVSFNYDSAGRRTSMSDGMGTTRWSYDNLNRATAITDPFHHTVGYTYDATGNRTGLTYPSGQTVSYGYDAANRLTTVTSGQSTIAGYQYDAANRLIDVTRANGVASSYTYDAAGHLTQLQHAHGTDTLSSFQYTYDNVGNRLQATESMQSGLVGPTVNVTVTESSGTPLAGKAVYVFDGTTFSGYSKVTDANGKASITLPAGSYRFRVDVDGTQFWSAAQNHCTIGQCGTVTMTIPQPVLVSVQDSDGTPREGLPVFAFNGATYTNFTGITNADGQLSLRLPQGSYRFRADFNGTQFWSAEQNDCEVPGCTLVSMNVTVPVTVSVKDDLDMPVSGVQVFAYNGDTYTNLNATTDSSGRAIFTLPPGNYRFRADFNNTQFWSAAQNDCSLPGCREDVVKVSLPVTVTVQDTNGAPQAGVPVFAFDGTTYKNISVNTDAQGHAVFTLPAGNYRFRADFNGTQFWGADQNNCGIPGCTNTTVTVTNGVLVTVRDPDGTPKAGLNVYAFSGTTYTGYHAVTDTNGRVTFTLPQGSYRFRADLNGTQFWSDTQNDCTLPGCGSANVTVSKPLTVTVHDTDGTAKAGLHVYVFNGTTYTNYNGTSDANGQVALTLPLGSYRFRADLNGTQFWSASQNHCTQPGCESAEVVVTIPVVITVQDGGGNPQSGIHVYVFNGTTYTNYNDTTGSNGQVVLTLPQGSYRFRADAAGLQYWSGTSNHCSLPGCTTVSVTVGPAMTATPGSTPVPTASATPTKTPTLENTVQANTATPTSSNTSTLEPTLTPTPIEDTATPSSTLTQESTPTETPTPGTPTQQGFQAGVHFVSLALQPHQQSNGANITVNDAAGTAKSGLNVYAFDGNSYTGQHGTTDSDGQVTLVLPDGSYRFRADFNGTQFWSGEQNSCTIPNCTSAAITVTQPVNITVQDSANATKAGLTVYAFDGSTYTGYSAVTDSSGQAIFTLPQGTYHFRADLNGTQFWSSESNSCTIPNCTSATITVTLPVTVSVQDTGNAPKAGLNVYAFDGSTFTGYDAVTDTNGQAVFTLPQGAYHFRSDLNGTQFWSDAQNNCTVVSTSSTQVQGCNSTSITVSIPIIVTVEGQTHQPYANLSVYAFDGGTYTGYNGMTDVGGHVTFTLPQGSYHFRAEFDSVQFWSNTQNDCILPRCTTETVTLPGGIGETNTTINYTYDPLYRLTNADYSNGDNYRYTYDAVGNRLQQESTVSSLQSIVNYQYDIANRLTNADNVNYTWDANGNLLNDGTSTYTYDPANRMSGAMQGSNTYTYAYSGLGDRLQQTVNGQTTNYILDINMGLTQVLDDGTNTYTYGVDRISKQHDAMAEYFLGDALGSVRQLADASDEITLTKSYDPYGNVISSAGSSTSVFAYTGEQGDNTGLTFLRARYYSPYLNQFIQPDSIVPDPRIPADWNRYLYTRDNPVNYTDSTGYITEEESKGAEQILEKLNTIYDVQIKKDWGYLNTFINTSNDYIDQSMNCVWMSGNWQSLHELELTLEAVKDITKKIGPQKGLFDTAIRWRPVKILRIPTETVFGAGARTTGDIIIIPNNVFHDFNPGEEDIFAKGQIVHEFGHVMDLRRMQQLSSGMGVLTRSFLFVCRRTGCYYVYDPTGQIEAPPTDYAQSNPLEDWAESFKYFVYPDFPAPKGILRPIRKGYIAKFIKDLATP